MANKEQRPAEVLGRASKYVGAGAGAVAVLGRGIGHAVGRSVKAAGDLLASRSEKLKAAKRTPKKTAQKKGPSKTRATAKTSAKKKTAGPKRAPKKTGQKQGPSRTQAKPRTRTRESASTQAKKDQAEAGPEPDTK